MQDTVGQLRWDLQQAVEEKQAGERRLREQNQQLPIMPARPHETITSPRPELQQPQEKQNATEKRQRKPMKQPGQPPQKTVVQQKAIRDMKWQEETKAPERNMFRGSTAADANMAYFNGLFSTKVHSYNSDTREWHQLPDAPYTDFTLVVVHHMLTMVGGMVGGEISGTATDALLSLMWDGRNKKWLPNLPTMPTKRYSAAAVCSGRCLIVAGGEDGSNTLATVEVLDTNTQQWSIASSLIYPFTEATMSICGERLYMLGGSQESHLKACSVLSCSVPELLQSCQPQHPTPSHTARGKKSTIWQYVTDAPHYRSSCATFCGQLVTVGGTNEANMSTSAINVYTGRTGRWPWEAMENVPTAQYMALVAVFNGKMMVVGGGTDVVETLC